MTDLIERLECFDWSCSNAEKIAKEAANTIATQAAEVARLCEALTTLRGHCNKHIKSINQGAGIHTPGFAQINKLLKQCDEAFKALEQKP